MQNIGITGATGFIGTHLINYLKLHSNSYNLVPFDRNCFVESNLMDSFVLECDVIVHLAAKNRHDFPEEIYKTNTELVLKITEACERMLVKPHIIYTSSIHEDWANHYGRSKRDARIIFENWALRNHSKFTAFILTNVFGPFGHPYYNSVVATFCYQLTHGEIPIIEKDTDLKLIYVGDLIPKIVEQIDLTLLEENASIKLIRIPNSNTITVSQLLNKLNQFKTNYFEKGVVPNLDDPFDRNLFNTFVCYIDHSSFFPFDLDLKTDDRGSFVETVKLNSGGQVSFSTTKPGVTRGNHFHTRKAERFAVIKGKAEIELRRIGTNQKFVFSLDGSNPSFVDMPIWFTHNIKNVGNEDVYTIFWISEHFDSSDPDTFFEVV